MAIRQEQSEEFGRSSQKSGLNRFPAGFGNPAGAVRRVRQAVRRVRQEQSEGFGLLNRFPAGFWQSDRRFRFADNHQMENPRPLSQTGVSI
ncbi:MAG: hypothetical protein DRI57_11650 [Deltaproteobacteria bacterium]|nr:MAG: hypothetical protein DRI57_11650 [Deltaproteobacteria bacterium]